MIRRALAVATCLACCIPSPAPAAADSPGVFARENLVAWCIVPFDKRQRGPEARAEMLSRLGIGRLAYDWRAEHIPTFDDELQTLARWGIALTAFWFPAALNDEARAILDALARNNVKTSLWVSMHGGDADCGPEEHAARVEAHAEALRPIVAAAAEAGHTVGLYNHGGWFGEPENQIEILRALDAPNAGIVYNLHHGHAHLPRFPDLLRKMQPHLLCLNLNGMDTDGDQIGRKIWPLGSGGHDRDLLRAIRDSGYGGHIGILGHTMDDAEDTLRDNLDGLDWLIPQLDGAPPEGPRPPLRAGEPEGAAGASSLAPAFGRALAGGWLAPGEPAYRTPPLTLELRARLDSKGSFNILAACDTKQSGAHWELFTEAGSGHLAIYFPGREPDHLRSGVDVCDGQWRHIAMHLGADHAALFVDGREVARARTTPTGKPAVPGGFAFGRLVEGGFGCDGLLDDARLSRGLRDIAVRDGPLESDGETLGLWSFDDLPDADATARRVEVEDSARRAALPLYQVIPAAPPEALAPAVEAPPAQFSHWTRSHGDDHNTRYAAHHQINRENVSRLRLAWTHRSGDGPGNVQCNPIVVDGLLIGPTGGGQLVGIDAATGTERWRFQPGGGTPAHRGLVHWAGDGGTPARLFFTAGTHLWALDPASGSPIASFGEAGRVASGESRVAGAVFEDILILPLFDRDVAAFDARTGARRWIFHTVPQPGSPAADTWSAPGEGANCWGGMALDAARGIAYVATGSPKPNFAGNTHTGQNLFANCVVAINARSGARLWHFQEIRHDIWDLDLPAPPNLVTITWQGRRVDAVAQVTKMGNTLLLDRVSGAPLHPFRLRRAPSSTLPGERTWPYQPDVELPEPFARQDFGPDDVTDRNAEARAHVLQRIAGARMGWFEPFAENVPTVFQGVHGGAEWTGAAYDPVRERLYVSVNHVPWIITVFRPDPVIHPPGALPTRGRAVYETLCMECHGADRFGVGMNPPLHGLARRHTDADVIALIREGRNAMPAAEGLHADDLPALLDYLFLRDGVGEAPLAPTNAAVRYTHNGYPKLLDHEGYPGIKPPWGTLNAIDLRTGRIAWRVPLGTYPDLAEWGEDDTGAENFGGPTATAGGLVFCAGTPDNRIRAFDADTGAVLWEHDLPFGGYAPPSVYEAGGRQFVALAATGGGKLGTPAGDAYIAFSLPDD